MRSLRWPVILFQLFWLNIFLPGHTRGSMTLGGGAGASCALASVRAGCCVKDVNTGKRVPSDADRARCAICDHVRGYSLPPVYSYVLEPAGTVIATLLVAAHQVDVHHVPLPYFPVGPPARA